MLFLVNIILERWLHVGSGSDTCYTPFRMAFHSTDCTQLISPFVCWRTFVLSQALQCYHLDCLGQNHLVLDPFPKSPTEIYFLERNCWDLGQAPSLPHTVSKVTVLTMLRPSEMARCTMSFHLSYFVHCHQQWVDSEGMEALHTPFLHQTIFYVTRACGSLFVPTHFFFFLQKGGCIAFLISWIGVCILYWDVPSLFLLFCLLPLLALWMAPLLLDLFSTSVLLVKLKTIFVIWFGKKENAN